MLFLPLNLFTGNGQPGAGDASEHLQAESWAGTHAGQTAETWEGIYAQFTPTVGRPGANLELGTMRVNVTNGRRDGLSIGRKVGPCLGNRRRCVLGGVHAFVLAVHAANTYRPRFQVRARPS